MDMAVNLGAGFGLSLLLAWCIAAFQGGSRVYGIAAAGVALTLLGRMAHDYASQSEWLWLQGLGIGLFAAVLMFDLLTEVVPLEDEALPDGDGSASSPPL